MDCRSETTKLWRDLYLYNSYTAMHTYEANCKNYIDKASSALKL